MNNLSLIQAIESYENIAQYLDVGMFSLALVISLLSAFAIAGMYRLFYESRGTGSQIHKSFYQLSLAITTLFLCIQVSIPLSLGLLGSLSIIRFRTPIKEPEEVGAVMLIVASSIAAATFHFAFIAIMLFLSFVALFIVNKARKLPFLKRDGIVTISFINDLANDNAKLSSILSNHLQRYTIVSSSSDKATTTMQISFSGLKSNVCDLQDSIRSNVNGFVSVNVFLDRPGGFR